MLFEYGMCFCNEGSLREANGRSRLCWLTAGFAPAPIIPGWTGACGKGTPNLIVNPVSLIIRLDGNQPETSLCAGRKCVPFCY